MFFRLATVLAVATTAYAARLILINNSASEAVYALAEGAEDLHSYVIAPQEQRVIEIADTWNGRVWGRTDCLGPEQCGYAMVVPTTLVELSISNGLSFYDVSLAEGFNIMTSVEPVGGTGEGDFSCKRSECAYPILDDCPAELVVNNGIGKYASCASACEAFNSDQYCCLGEYGVPENCKPSDWPVDYAAFFKERCPKAYSYPFDVQNTMYTCDATDFIITFL